MSQNQKKVLEIISLAEVPAINPQRLGQYDTLVTYRVDPLHIFTVRCEGSNLNKQQIAQCVKADYDRKGSLVGMKIEV